MQTSVEALAALSAALENDAALFRPWASRFPAMLTDHLASAALSVRDAARYILHSLHRVVSAPHPAQALLERLDSAWGHRSPLARASVAALCCDLLLDPGAGGFSEPFLERSLLPRLLSLLDDPNAVARSQALATLEQLALSWGPAAFLPALRRHPPRQAHMQELTARIEAACGPAALELAGDSVSWGSHPSPEGTGSAAAASGPEDGGSIRGEAPPSVKPRGTARKTPSSRRAPVSPPATIPVSPSQVGHPFLPIHPHPR